jgi:hypothetical protein
VPRKMSFNLGSALPMYLSEGSETKHSMCSDSRQKTRTILSDDRDLTGGASGGAFRLPSWCLRELAKLFVGVPGGHRAEVTKTRASAVPHDRRAAHRDGPAIKSRNPGSLAERRPSRWHQRAIWRDHVRVLVMDFGVTSIFVEVAHRVATQH